MRLGLLLVVVMGVLLQGSIPAQTNSAGWVPTSTTSTGPASTGAQAVAPETAASPTPSPASSAASTSSKSPAAASAAGSAPATTSSNATGGDADEMTEDDFLIDGVPYAKVLYMEGNVWIRPPDDADFHKLDADEPIPNQSVLYTGFNGILDFATGPGMAVRMVPRTGLVVNALPSPTTSSTTPAASQVDLRRGTIFSALGRENGAPIDYTVQTPMGVAAARGTMFATSVLPGTTQVSMLHGTVAFQSPDHQTSRITAGQSQQINGGAGGKYTFASQKPMSPANSDAFFNHAGGLLEHASGYGVVRHGLGPDVAREMQRHGYKMPDSATQHMQNAGRVRYHAKPSFNHAKTPQARAAANHHATPGLGGQGTHPLNETNHTAGQSEKQKWWHKPGEHEKWPEKDKNWGN